MTTSTEEVDVLLVGAGIMSATLASLLHQVEPNLNIQIIEQLAGPAQESSNAWNNAGTGHAALCELNYTPLQKDGSIDISKAVKINTSFEESKQLWAYLVEQNAIDSPDRFIHPVPHISFVKGKDDVEFLNKRYSAMHAHPCFSSMKFTTENEQIKEWAPLLFEGRTGDTPLAATRVEEGADVDYGALTRLLFDYLEREKDVKVAYNQKVQNLTQDGNSNWYVDIVNKEGKEIRQIKARFVFIGAGGAALTLLQKSAISEARRYAGFPVSGQWLRCDDPDIVSRHQAKVYSKASVGAPPMSVPHLDTRVVDGKKSLLFGPFAGFTTRFLKTGSLLDLPLSITFSNFMPILDVAKGNFPLVKYLVGQVMLTHKQRVEALRDFYPDARDEDWRLQVAGERVQIIKQDDDEGGKLQFGTEIVSNDDNSLAALLGASPGASTAVSIMLQVLERCFSERYYSSEWQGKLDNIFTGRADLLAENGELLKKVRAHTHKVLGLAFEDADTSSQAATDEVSVKSPTASAKAESTSSDDKGNADTSTAQKTQEAMSHRTDTLTETSPKAPQETEARDAVTPDHQGNSTPAKEKSAQKEKDDKNTPAAEKKSSETNGTVKKKASAKTSGNRQKTSNSKASNTKPSNNKVSNDGKQSNSTSEDSSSSRD
ncbi:malate:quinone oxidoreductase [Halomonadaceae bacterium LMG 33818]|uniref:malate dehydrogenase (quinone) n=1 Tax=Cernens ardua TaxID=3402176 RepID=UPI003EDBF415